MISKGAIVVATREQVSSDLAGEVVILNLNRGVYYGLDEVGALVWNLIQEPRPVEAIRDAILEGYEVEPDRCERDLLALLQDMEAAGLVEVTNATSA